MCISQHLYIYLTFSDLTCMVIIVIANNRNRPNRYVDVCSCDRAADLKHAVVFVVKCNDESGHTSSRSEEAVRRP